MGKVETFLYGVSFLMPIGEDETLTIYRKYAKELEQELKIARIEREKLKNEINVLLSIIQ